MKIISFDGKAKKLILINSMNRLLLATLLSANPNTRLP